jgi:hypothetical protein
MEVSREKRYRHRRVFTLQESLESRKVSERGYKEIDLKRL